MPTCKTDLEVRLYEALKRITQYQSPERLKKKSWDDWGLPDGNEALEYAYENVLQEAKRGIRNVRPRPLAAAPRPQEPAQ